MGKKKRKNRSSKLLIVGVIIALFFVLVLFLFFVKVTEKKNACNGTATLNDYYSLVNSTCEANGGRLFMVWDDTIPYTLKNCTVVERYATACRYPRPSQCKYSENIPDYYANESYEG
jgi:hypothetical protein